MADLNAGLEVPVVCQFIKPETRAIEHGSEISYSPEAEVKGQHVLRDPGVLIRNLGP